jgi:membrane-bound serine protease (ClpP class)
MTRGTVVLTGHAVVLWNALLLVGRTPEVLPPELASAVRPCALIEVSSSINPGTSDFIQSSIDRAHREAMGCLILQLNTPGGLLKATREIVSKLLTAPLPVAVYVAPPGAHAGSAGAFITMAAAVAAMAPGTNIGAAHPVAIGAGGQVDQESAKHVARKAEEDAAAFLRSIAKVRNRNLEWAEKAVRESKALPHQDALRHQVVDLVATDIPDLLRQMDGRTVEVRGQKVKLRTAGAAVIPYSMSLKQAVINFFSDPTIAYVLMMLGILGILAEVYHPGVIFPGVLGAICLIVAFISFQVLPINYGGLLLIVLAVGLFVAEIYVTSYGVLAVGGIVSLVLGSVLFIDPGGDSEYSFSPDFGISLGAVIPTAVVLGAFSVYLGWVILRGRRAPQTTGKEGLVGEEGEVLSVVGPEGGRVFVHGEYWNARADQEIGPGEKVRVVGVDGLTLKVVRR